MVALVIVSQVAALLGDLVLAGIVDRNPALLIALNPRNRNLALATNQLSAVTYYLVGFGRLVASDPLYYLLGYWFGDRAISWTERRSRTYGPFIRDGERLFRQASYPLIFLAPNSIICALAAATGVRIRAFIALNISGTVARLIVVRYLGEVFSSPIERVLGFIAQYRVPLLILSAIGVAWTIFGEFRGDNSELNNLRHLEEEAEAELDAAAKREAASAADGDVAGDGGPDTPEDVGRGDDVAPTSAPYGPGDQTGPESERELGEVGERVVADLGDELLHELVEYEPDDRSANGSTDPSTDPQPRVDGGPNR